MEESEPRYEDAAPDAAGTFIDDSRRIVVTPLPCRGPSDLLWFGFDRGYWLAFFYNSCLCCCACKFSFAYWKSWARLMVASFLAEKSLTELARALSYRLGLLAILRSSLNIG